MNPHDRAARARRVLRLRRTRKEPAAPSVALALPADIAAEKAAEQAAQARRHRRGVRARAFTIVVGIVAAVVLTPALAWALPGDPDPPSPEKPGDGMIGWLDDQKHPAYDQTVYGTYGYAGLHWNTYDLGVGGDLRDPWAIVDTGFGNWLFTGAKFFTALANSLHQANRPDSLDGLNPVLDKGTQAVHDALYQPFLPIVLLVLAALLLWRTHRSDLPASVRAVSWAMLVMIVAVGLFQYPQRAVHGVDDAETATIAQIDNGFAKASGTSGDPTLSQSEMLVDTVLYRQWLRGEFGNPDSAVAKKYGRDLLDAQAFSRDERLVLDKNPPAALLAAQHKNDKFNEVAAKIKKEDPAAYDYLTGHSHARMGAGFVSMTVALPTAGFRAVSDLLVFAARIIIRLLVIFFPGLAIAGILMIGPVRTAFIAGAAALVNSVVFSVGAGLNVLAANILLGPDVHLPTWLAVVFLAVISLIMWRAFKPFRHLTAMVNPNHNFYEVAAAPTGRGLRRLASTAVGTYLGRRMSQDGEEPEGTDPDSTERKPYWRPENVSTDPYLVYVRSSRVDDEVPVALALPGGAGGGARRALPPGADAARAVLVGPPGRGSSPRAEEMTVYIQEGVDPVEVRAADIRVQTDVTTRAHVTETVTVETPPPRYSADDLPSMDVFRPGSASVQVRVEAETRAEAEIIGGREVDAIYRPGGGLEVRDAVW